MKILLTLILMSPNIAYACDSIATPVFCQIKSNNPSIDTDYAHKIARIVYDTCKKYGVDHKIYTAILMQESAYKLDARNCKVGYKKGTREIANVCFDFGISQINFNTIQDFEFDKELLVTDLAYSIEAGVKVLKNFQNRYAHKETDWYTRYNSSNKEKRSIYMQLISRYMK